MAATAQKPPSQKIRATAILRSSFMLRRAMTGKGRLKTRRSSAKLLATCASPSAALSNRSAVSVSGNLMGSISRSTRKKKRRPQMLTRPMTNHTAVRNMGVEKIRR
jgi:hypothetical protein